MKLKILLLAVISGSLLMCSKSSDSEVASSDSICHVVVDSKQRRSTLSFFFGESPAEGYLIEFIVKFGKNVQVKGTKCEILVDNYSFKPMVLTQGVLVSKGAGIWSSNQLVLSDVHNNTGPFDGPGEGFLGFRVPKKDGYQYGWFRLTCEPGKAVLRVLDYAISLTPDAAIKCGDTGNLGQCENWPLVSQILNPDHVVPGPYKPLGSAGNTECNYYIEFIDDPKYDFKLSPLPFMSGAFDIYGTIEYGMLKIEYVESGMFINSIAGWKPFYFAVRGYGFYYKKDGKPHITLNLWYKRDDPAEFFDGTIEFDLCE